MPRFDDEDMQSQKIGGSGYGFSGKRLDALDATSEWTICDFEFDMSGSVDCFAAEIERCAIEAIRSCKHSPRADNLMLRTQTFNHALHEVHGFRPLGECDEAKYVGIIQPGGGTALFDAIHNGASALNKYGADLVAAKYTANGILIVVTDGCENGNSSATALMCKKAIEGARAGEKLESLITILRPVRGRRPQEAGGRCRLHPVHRGEGRQCQDPGAARGLHLEVGFQPEPVARIRRAVPGSELLTLIPGLGHKSPKPGIRC